MSEPPSAGSSPIEILTRWEQHGALWRVIRVDPDAVTVELCSCVGERVDELRSDDPRLRDYVARRPRSEIP